MSEQNKAASRVAFDVWNSGELDRLDSFVAAHVLHHDRYDPHGAQGLPGMKKTIMKNREVYPDLAIVIADQLAEGDKVATRWIATMMREGKQVSLSGVTIDRFENGKIVEAWRTIDMLGMLQQLGDPVAALGTE